MTTIRTGDRPALPARPARKIIMILNETGSCPRPTQEAPGEIARKAGGRGDT
jgi:hypothetical protein